MRRHLGGSHMKLRGLDWNRPRRYAAVSVPLILATTLFMSGCPNRQPTQQKPADGKYADLGSYRIFYRDSGTPSGADEDTLVQGLDELWQQQLIREHGGRVFDGEFSQKTQSCSGSGSPHQRSSSASTCNATKDAAFGNDV